jgi:hypothetical protein
MTRFVTISSKALARLVSRLGDEHAVVKAVKRGQEGFRSAYRDTLGKELREGRVLIPESLYKKAMKEVKIKPLELKRSGELERYNDLVRGRRTTGIKNKSVNADEMWTQIGNRERMKRKKSELEAQHPGGARYALNRRKALAEYYKAKSEGRMFLWPSNAGPYPGEKTNPYYKK